LVPVLEQTRNRWTTHFITRHAVGSVVRASRVAECCCGCIRGLCETLSNIWANKFSVYPYRQCLQCVCVQKKVEHFRLLQRFVSEFKICGQLECSRLEGRM
jgi:hypothetical protein